jgi:hypothetical protein
LDCDSRRFSYHSIVFSHSIVEIVLWQQNQPTKKPVEEIPVQPKMSKATKRFGVAFYGSDPHYFERLQDNYVQNTKGDEPRVSEPLPATLNLMCIRCLEPASAFYAASALTTTL